VVDRFRQRRGEDNARTAGRPRDFRLICLHYQRLLTSFSSFGPRASPTPWLRLS
jgi:hypothetical protein